VSVKLTIRQVGDVTVIDATGRITLGEGASTFRDSIRDLATKGDKKLLVNLSDVSYIDSSGIGEMVSGFTTVTNHGGQLKLLGLSKRVKDLTAFPAVPQQEQNNPKYTPGSCKQNQA